jgi:hypothetical protein
MGWLFTSGQTRSELIHRRTKSWANEEAGLEAKCLEHCTVGNVLWTVWEHRHRDGAVQRYIGCDLMAPQRGYGWGYKDMEESMGPCYYSCPLKYLDQVPEPDSRYAKEWRGKVRAYHAKRKALVIGATVKLERCSIPELTIVSLRPLLGMYAGIRYRIPLKLLC